jgi:hypothetical protein
VELDAKRDKDSIIKAVQEGEFWNCYLCWKEQSEWQFQRMVNGNKVEM